MWARIENGTVAEITDIDPTGRFHPSLLWQPVGQVDGCGPGWLWDGKTFTAPTITAPDAEELCARIDAAADAARSRVAGDPLRAVEYDRARIEAQAFADVGYPADAVPRTVAAWAINGRTAQQAADSILAEAAAYTEALYVIRETRLAAKEQIRTLMDAGEVEQAQLLAEQTIAVIEAAVAGVGNNAGG
ncbi:phage tail protein [Stutzerimonas balearica]|uniref:phage tail protein n=1 Tax=Stutzerimonas balearica TaxID=74829 RepID=UPI00289EE4AA|nr:phage tail protein [Stutzerimonas balearica]